MNKLELLPDDIIADIYEVNCPHRKGPPPLSSLRGLSGEGAADQKAVRGLASRRRPFSPARALRQAIKGTQNAPPAALRAQSSRRGLGCVMIL